MEISVANTLKRISLPRFLVKHGNSFTVYNQTVINILNEAWFEKHILGFIYHSQINQFQERNTDSFFLSNKTYLMIAS